MITTYPGLITQLGQMIAFDYDNPGDASPGMLQAAVALAEERIYREAQTRFNTANFGVSDTVTSNAYSLPANFQSIELLHFGKRPLDPVSIEWLQDYLQCQNTGDVRYFAKRANQLVFGPTLTDGTQLQGSYYISLPALSSATLPSNALFAASNSLFLFAAMVEAAPLAAMPQIAPAWEAKYQSVLASVNSESAMTAYSAGRIKRRASTRLLG